MDKIFTNLIHQAIFLAPVESFSVYRGLGKQI